MSKTLKIEDLNLLKLRSLDSLNSKFISDNRFLGTMDSNAPSALIARLK